MKDENLFPSFQEYLDALKERLSSLEIISEEFDDQALDVEIMLKTLLERKDSYDINPDLVTNLSCKLAMLQLIRDSIKTAMSLLNREGDLE